MSSPPQLTVEIAFGSARAIGDPTTPWVDVTAYVRGVAIKGGRQHEMDRVQASTCDVRLRNVGGQFDPAGLGTYATTPFSRLRVRATVAGTTYDLFHGYVEQFEQTYPGGAKHAAGNAEVIAHAVDALKILGLLAALTTRARVASMDPWLTLRWITLPLSPSVRPGYYRCPVDGGSGATEVPMFETGLTWGSTGFLPGGQSLLRYADPSQACYAMSSSDTGTWWSLGDTTICTWLQPFNGTQTALALVNVGGRWSARLVQNGAVWDLLVHVTLSGGAEATATIPSVAPHDTAWHHYAITRSVTLGTSQTFGVAVDGVLKGSATINGDPQGYAIPRVLAHDPVNGLYTDSPNFTLSLMWGSVKDTDAGPLYEGLGRWAHLGIWCRVLSAPEIVSLAAVAFEDQNGTFAAGKDYGIPSGLAIGNVLRAAGWPPGYLVLDAGASSLAATALQDNLLDTLVAMSNADGGALYLRGDGVIRFRDRNSLWSAATPPTISDNPAAAGTIPYADLTISSDDSQTWTRVEIKASSGALYMAEDAVATATYGQRVLSLELVGLLDSDAQARANYLLTLYATQRSRATGAAFTLTRDDVSAFVLGAQLLDRVTVARTTPGGHTWSQVSWIEGWELTIDGRSPWTANLDLVPAIAPP